MTKEGQIARLWTARVANNNAAEYENFIARGVFDRLVGKGHGYPTAAQYLAREVGAETEVTIILWFDSLAEVKIFAGEDFTKAVVDDTDLRLLASYDREVRHSTVKLSR